MKESDLVVKIIQLIRRHEQQNLNDSILQESIINIIKELKKQIKNELKRGEF